MHYVLFVVVPQEETKTQDKLETYISKQLAKYDEQLEVEPYLRNCWCLNEDDQPNKDCGSCHGEGKYETTYNPLGKWDWYVIGGRWNKYIPRNCTRIKSLNDDTIPFACVNSKGDWYERGGFDGVNWQEKSLDEWSNEFRSLIAKENPQDYVICLDSHG